MTYRIFVLDGRRAVKCYCCLLALSVVCLLCVVARVALFRSSLLVPPRFLDHRTSACRCGYEALNNLIVGSSFQFRV